MRFIMLVFLGLATLLVSANCSFLKEDQFEGIRFHVIGDNGLYPIPGSQKDGKPYFVQDPIDKANPMEMPNLFVGEKMNEVALENPIDFVIGIGDSFYQFPDGLQNINDPRVEYMLNTTYGLPALKDATFHMTLGNHDCYGNPDIEVEISNIHKRWSMPARYYSQVFDLDNGKKALFLFLDGCVLSASEAVKGGQTYHEFSFPVTESMVQEHMAWIESTLKKYENDESIAWRVVSIHWPFFSIGYPHNDTDALKFNLLPMLVEYKIDAVLSGHDHNSQYINMKYEIVQEGKVQPANNSTKECNILPIGIEESKDLRYTQGELIHQFVVGNSGYPSGPLCKSRMVEYENYLYGAWVYGFAEVEITSESFVVRTWAAHTENFLTQVTIESASATTQNLAEPELAEDEYQQWYDWLDVLERLLTADQ